METESAETLLIQRYRTNTSGKVHYPIALGSKQLLDINKKVLKLVTGLLT